MKKDRGKTAAAVFSLAVSLLLVAIKVLVAYFSNSLGVFSEALNNGLDLVTVLIAFMAVRISMRPPDKDHTYGHGKYENVSAAIELVIISLLSLYIIYRSINRLIYRDFLLNLNIYVFAVLIFSIMLNILRVFIIGRAARKYRSSIFEAEFLNYMGDIASSIIVIAGLLLARNGFMLADPVASIIVAVIVLVFSLRLSVKVFRNLLDYIPEEVTTGIRAAAASVSEIKKINELRIHEVGNIKFININVSIDENIYLPRVEKIKQQAKKAIKDVVPDSRIILEIKTDIPQDDIISRVKGIILDRKEIEDAHNISIYDVGGMMDVSMHINIGKHLCLEDTELLTKGIEEELQHMIPELRSVYIHIEDNLSRGSFEDITSGSKDLIDMVKKAISSYIDPDTCHNFTILRSRGKFSVAFHCRLDQDLKVDQAHIIITDAENHIRKKITNIGDIAIHVEPFS